MSNVFVLGKVEEALQLWLQEQELINIDPEYIYCGIWRTAEDPEAQIAAQVLPCVVCWADSADPIDPQSFYGNWKVNASIQVKVSASESSVEFFRALAGEIFGYLITKTLADDLTAAVDEFNVDHVEQGTMMTEIEDQTWIAQLDLILTTQTKEII